MHIVAVHVCPHCYALQPLTGAAPARAVCLSCGFQDTAPAHSVFGREEWDRSQHPARMLACLKELGIDAGARKMRLVSCAAARAHLPRAASNKLKKAVELAEEWADTGTRPEEADRTLKRFNSWEQRDLAPVQWVTDRIGRQCLADHPTEIEVRSYPLPELLAPIYRDLFPNPFARVTWNPDWLSSTVRDLARHIYTHHEFDTMPILADVLQDAGCDAEPVLAHCRANRPHARGCWVLDAILGKS